MPAGIGTGNVIGSAFLRIGTQVDTSGAKQGLSSLGLMAGSTAKQIGRVFGVYAGAAGLAMAIKSSTDAFVQFDKAVKNSWTLVNKTNAEMEKSGNAVRAMAREFNVGSTQSEKALYQIWSATFYGADSMEILRESTKGAAAGLSDLMSTADMVTTVLNAYGKSASEAAHINDLLFTAVRYGKVNYSQLSEQFGRLAGVAAPTGASIEDMVAAIATLTRQGIEADWAVTSLRQTLMQFIKPTKNLKAAINDLGYSGGSAMIKANGFAKALRMVTKWAKDNNIEMDQMFTNVRAVTAVLPLATTAAAGYAKDQQRMADSAGQAALAFKKQTQSISYQLQKFATLFGDLAISVGKTFVPAMMGAVKALEALATPLRGAFDIFNKLGGGYFVAIATGLATLTAGVWLAAKAYGALSLAVGTVARGSGLAAAGMLRLLDLGAKLGAGTWFTALLRGGAALGVAGLGAGFAIKQAIDFNFTLGNVTGIEEVKRALTDSISAVLGLAASGAIIGSMFGGALAGGVIGAGVGAAAAITIYVVHEIRTSAAAAATTAHEAVNATNLPYSLSPQGMFDMAKTISGAEIASQGYIDVLKVLTRETYELVDGTWQLRGFTKEAKAVGDVFSNLTRGLTPSLDQLGDMMAYMREKTLTLLNAGGPLLSSTDQRIMLIKALTMAQEQYIETIRNSHIDISSIISSFKLSISSFGAFGDNVGWGIDALVAKVKKDFESLPQDTNTDKVKTELIYQIWRGLGEADIPENLRNAFLAGFSMTKEDLVKFLLGGINTASGGNKPAIVQNVSTDWAADQKKFADLKSELEKGGLTADEVTKHWKDLTDVQKKWSGLMPILAKLGYDVSGSMSGVIEGWKSYLALDTAKSWMQKAQDLAKVMQDGTASTQERADAEKGLVSLYGEIAASAKSTIPGVRSAAKATMDFIAGTNVDLSKYVTDWGASIQSLTDILKNSKVPQDRIDAYSSLMSWGEKLAAMEKGLADTEYAFLIPAIQALEDKIKAAGVAIPAALTPSAQSVKNFSTSLESLKGDYEKYAAGTMEHAYAAKTLASMQESLNASVKDGSVVVSALNPDLQTLVKWLLGLDLVTQKLGPDFKAQIEAYQKLLLAAQKAGNVAASVSALSGLRGVFDTMVASIDVLVAAGIPGAETLDAMATNLSKLYGFTRKASSGIVKLATAIDSSIGQLISKYGGPLGSDTGNLVNALGPMINAGIAGTAVTGNIIVGLAVAGITLAIDAITLMINHAAEEEKKRQEELKQLANDVMSSFKFLNDVATSLAGSFVGIISQSDAYKALQDNLTKIMQVFRNAIASFIWPLVAIAEALGLLVGVTNDSANAITKETEKRMASLNVPEGYKVTRNEWRAATPGQPPIEVPSGTNGSTGSGSTGIQIPQWAKDIIAPFTEIISKIGDSLKTFLGDLIDAAGIIAGPFAGAVLTVLETFAKPLEDLGEWIKGTLAPDLANFFTAFGNWWSSDVDPFLQSEMFPQLSKWGAAIYEWIKKDFLPFLTGEVWPFFKKDLWPVIVDGINGLGAALKELWDYIVKHWPEIKTLIVDKLKKWFDSLIGKVKDVTTWLDLLLSPIQTGVGLFGQFFAALWNAIKAIPKFVAATLKLAFDIIMYPFKFVGVILYNIGVAINNAIQFILNLLNPFSSGNQLPYKPLPSLAEGGKILSEGAAYLHANEIVVPARTAPLATGNGTQVIDNRIYLDGGLLWHGMRKVNAQQERRKTGSSHGSRAWVSG